MYFDLVIGKEFPAKVIPLIDRAKSEIRIIVFDWRWYPNDPSNPVQLFNQALVRASRRGVSVSVITNSNDIVSILCDLGIKAKKPSTANLIHVKLMLLDNELLVIGSHNYTQSAFTMNYEVSLIVAGAFDTKRLTDFFGSLFF